MCKLTQQVSWYFKNLFFGFIFYSCRALFLNLFLLLLGFCGFCFFPIWGPEEKKNSNKWLISAACVSLCHLLWQRLSCSVPLPQSHRHRDTAGLIGNNPSAVISVVHCCFLEKTLRVPVCCFITGVN